MKRLNAVPDFIDALAHFILLAEMSAELSWSGSYSCQHFPRSVSLFDIFVSSGLIKTEFFCSQAPIEMGSSMHLKTARPDILSLKLDLLLLLFMCLVSFCFLSLNHPISSIFNRFKPTFGLMKARNHFLLVKDTRQLLGLSHKLTRQSLTLLRKPVTDAG